MVEELSTAQIVDELKTLPGWVQLDNRNALQKQFKFKNFNKAWAFMTHIATLAEDMNHHPEWSNIYNHVNIVLTTHDAGGISERDICMAREIEKILERF